MAQLPVTHFSVPQAGGILFRLGADGSIHLMLVTSRSRSRWVFPKGRIESGHDAVQTVAIEAFEEAGVYGRVIVPSLGTFQYSKDGVPAQVEVFLLQVEEELERWPEDRSRSRRWFTAEEALAQHGRPEAREVMARAVQTIRRLVALKLLVA